MKQIVFDQCGNPEDVLYLTNVPDVKPGKGEVLLKILMTPIHPADIAFIRGLYVPPDSWPARNGFEAVGRVDAIGPDVDKVSTGERYVVSRVRGTWSDKMIVPANALVTVPDDIPDETACQLLVNPLTALLLLKCVTSPGAIVQTAAGSAVGRLVNQLGEREGRRVINIVRHQETADDLKAHGFKHVVIASDKDWKEAVRSAAGKDPVVAAFDPVAGRTGEELLSVLSPCGELILYGGLSGEPVKVGAMALAGGNVSVRGFWLAPWFSQTSADEKSRVINELITLFRQHHLEIPVAGIFPLEKFKEAIQDFQAPGRLGKILLRNE